MAETRDNAVRASVFCSFFMIHWMPQGGQKFAEHPMCPYVMRVAPVVSAAEPAGPFESGVRPWLTCRLERGKWDMGAGTFYTPATS
ncbi:hypothetical protein GCM10018965_052170 [Nonomuraea roseola]